MINIQNTNIYKTHFNLYTQNFTCETVCNRTTLLLEKPCVYCINSNFQVPALQKKGRLSSTFVKWLVQVVWAHSCMFFLAINVSNSAQIRGLNIRTDQCNTSSNNSRSFLYWHDTLTALYPLFCTHRWR